MFSCSPFPGSNEWDFSGCERRCKDGLIRLDRCMAGAPLAMSAPHFLYGDPELVDAIDGVQPDQALHETVLNVDPLLGIVLQGHKKIQVQSRVGYKTGIRN